MLAFVLYAGDYNHCRGIGGQRGVGEDEEETGRGEEGKEEDGRVERGEKGANEWGAAEIKINEEIRDKETQR